MVRLPQFAHVPLAVVMSLPKTASSVPAIALPSSASIELASTGPEAFCADPAGFMPEGDQGARRGLHKRRRAADVDERALAGHPGDFLEKVAIDPPCIAAPPFRLLAGQGEADVDHPIRPHPNQLRPIDHLRE